MEEGPSIRGPGPGQCAVGVRACAGAGASAHAGARVGTGTEEAGGPPVLRGAWGEGRGPPGRVCEETGDAVVQRAEMRKRLRGGHIICVDVDESFLRTTRSLIGYSASSEAG